MSEELYWILEVDILPGQLANFESVARDLIAATTNEPDTLGYEYALNADETVCHIYERYKNSEAVLTHVRSFGNFAERFMQACCPTRCYVYGNVSEEVKASIGDLRPVYFSLLGGFSR